MSSTKYDLYGGSVQLNYLEKAGKHRYLVNGKEKIGVTTVIKEALNSGPGITWPMYEALKHLQMPGNEADYDGAGKAYMRKGDLGKNIGTLTHKAIELYLKGEQYEVQHDIQKPFYGFMDWYKDQNIEVLKLEQPVYSRAGDYCGTFDALLNIDGKIVLCDWKTTNKSREAPKGVYWSSFVQLGGYGFALLEMDGILIDDYAVVNVGKDGVTNMVRARDLYVSVEECNVSFIAALELYRFRNRLKEELSK